MKKKKNIGYKKELFLAIVTLAWPTLLEQMLQTLVQYIDAAMVGNRSRCNCNSRNEYVRNLACEWAIICNGNRVYGIYFQEYGCKTHIKIVKKGHRYIWCWSPW